MRSVGNREVDWKTTYELDHLFDEVVGNHNVGWKSMRSLNYHS